MPPAPVSPPSGGGRCAARSAVTTGHQRHCDQVPRFLRRCRIPLHSSTFLLRARSLATRIGTAGGAPVHPGNDPVHARRLVTPGTMVLGSAEPEARSRWSFTSSVRWRSCGTAARSSSGREATRAPGCAPVARERGGLDRSPDRRALGRARRPQQHRRSSRDTSHGFARSSMAGTSGRTGRPPEGRHPADPVAGVRPPGRGRTARRGPLRDAARQGADGARRRAQRTRRRHSSARRWISGAARRSPSSPSTRSRRRRSPASRSSAWPPSRNGSRPISRSDAPRVRSSPSSRPSSPVIRCASGCAGS